MKKISKAFLQLLFLLIVMAAKPVMLCPSEPTNTELITNKNWVIYSASVYPPYYDENIEDTVKNALVVTDTCFLDDTLRFYSSGSYEVDNGENHCDTSAGQIDYYDWYFNGNEDSLVVISFEDDSAKTFPDTSYVAILKLTSDTLRITSSYLIDTNVRAHVVTYISN
jgi:hypothetical protein